MSKQLTECTLKNCHKELITNAQQITGFCTVLHLQWHKSGDAKLMERKD